MSGYWTANCNNPNDGLSIIRAYAKAPALRGQMVPMVRRNEAKGFFLRNGLEVQPW
jgi:hypothetical protein